MKFSKTLLLASLICASQVQGMNYTKESLKGLKDKVALASFLTGFWWHYLTKNQKAVAKFAAVASAAYLAKKFINSLEGQAVQKNETALNDNQESKANAELDEFQIPDQFKPDYFFKFERTETDLIVLEHEGNETCKFIQLLKLCPGIGLVLSDIKFNKTIINASEISLRKDSVTIEFGSRVVVIRQNDEDFYELVSDEQRVQKNKVEEPLNDDQESKADAEFVDLCQEPVNYFISERTSSDVIDLHHYDGHSKFEQLIDLFPFIGHILLDAKITSDKINMSKVSIFGKTITIQLNLQTCSRMIVIKKNGDYSYELVSNDTVYHEPTLNAI